MRWPDSHNFVLRGRRVTGVYTLLYESKSANSGQLQGEICSAIRIMWVLYVLLHGKGNEEGAALVYARTFGADCAAVRLDESFGYGQSETGAFAKTLARRVSSV